MMRDKHPDPEVVLRCNANRVVVDARDAAEAGQMAGQLRTRQMAQRKEVDSAESPERGESPGVVSSEKAAAARAAPGAASSDGSIWTASPAENGMHTLSSRLRTWEALFAYCNTNTNRI